MILRRLSQFAFGLLLLLLLATHASSSGGPFSWRPLPLPTAVSGLSWQIGLLSLLPLAVVFPWLIDLFQDIWRKLSSAKPIQPSFTFPKKVRRETAVFLPLALFSFLVLTRLTAETAYIAAMLGLCWMILLFLWKNPDWQRDNLWPVLAVVLLVQGAVALGQFLRQGELGLVWLGEPTLDLLVEGTSVAQRGGQHWLRAYGLNSHPNQLGLLLMALCLLIWPQRHRAQGWRRWLFWLSLLAGLAGMLTSLSRSAWLGLAIGGLVYTIQRRSPRPLLRREVVLPMAIMAAGFLLFALAYGDVLAGRLLALDSPLESRSLLEREQATRTALQLIGERPFQGVGLNQYLTAAENLDVAAAIVHNVPLLIATELGLVALALWLWFWAGPLWRYGRFPASRSGTAVWLSLIVVALVQPEPTLFLPKGAALWGLASAQWLLVDEWPILRSHL